MPTLLKDHTRQEHALSLADYLPNGPLFLSKKLTNKNIYKLLYGLAGLLKEAEENLNLVASEYDIRYTTQFIEEWEGFVGIPDDCFPVADTLEQRRANVLTKLTALGVQTEHDFVVLASLFGVEITIDKGIEIGGFPIGFPAMLFETSKQARFTMIINFTTNEPVAFPLTFPLPLGTDEIGVLECLFNSLKPANVKLIFRQI